MADVKYKEIFKIRINYKSGYSFEGWFSVFKFEEGIYKWESTISPDAIEELHNLLKYNDFDEFEDYQKIKIAKDLAHYSNPLILGADNIESVFQMEGALIPIIPEEKVLKVEKYIQQIRRD